VITTDKYGRKVCRVEVDGQDLSVELLRAGLAWHYKRYNQEPALASLQAEARARKRGLWADPNPIPPWEWRRRKRS
jgi:endonuclease YncB( thermonuclease family)